MERLPGKVVRSLDEIDDLGKPWYLVPDQAAVDAGDPGESFAGWTDIGATTDHSG